MMGEMTPISSSSANQEAQQVMESIQAQERLNQIGGVRAL